MDSNSSLSINESLNGNTQNNSYLLIRLPCNVQNENKAIQMLGGNENILEKFNKNDDLKIKIADKTINLEKCISNDFLLKRKTYRNKKDPSIIKYSYKLIGRIQGEYDYFCLHDFIYEKDNIEDVSIRNLQNFLIDMDEFKKTDIPEENSEKIKEILRNQKDKMLNENMDFKDIIEHFQPSHLAVGRLSYPYNFRELKKETKLESIYHDEH